MGVKISQKVPSLLCSKSNMGSFDRNDQELLETLHQIMVIFCMKLHLVEIVQLNSV